MLPEFRYCQDNQKMLAGFKKIAASNLALAAQRCHEHDKKLMTLEYFAKEICELVVPLKFINKTMMTQKERCDLHKSCLIITDFIKTHSVVVGCTLESCDHTDIPLCMRGHDFRIRYLESKDFEDVGYRSLYEYFEGIGDHRTCESLQYFEALLTQTRA